MKKFLFTAIAILFVVALSSCAGNVSDAEHAVVTKNEKLVEYTEMHESDGGFVTDEGYISSIRHFKYKNHKYIHFITGVGTQCATGGVVHDPDCHCNK